MVLVNTRNQGDAKSVCLHVTCRSRKALPRTVCCLSPWTSLRRQGFISLCFSSPHRQCGQTPPTPPPHPGNHRGQQTTSKNQTSTGNWSTTGNAGFATTVFIGARVQEINHQVSVMDVVIPWANKCQADNTKQRYILFLNKVTEGCCSV